MLLTILARMSNDEQRLQLLQTLRKKLPSYDLGWFEVRDLVELFSEKDHIRWDVLQILLEHMPHSTTKKIDVEEYIHLANRCTNENDYSKVQLLEQMMEKLNIRGQEDLERIRNSFQRSSLRQKVEAILRNYRLTSILYEEEVPTVVEFDAGDHQLTSLQWTLSSRQSRTNDILSPGLPVVEELSHAPLKRKYSFDQTCQQIVAPSSISQEDEYVQQRDFPTSVSIRSSDSSLSSASDENIPIRTRSFMLAIKNTFERLKETSS